MSRQCILHLTPSGCYDGDIKQFDDDTWQQVKVSDESRHRLFQQSKYFLVVLPEVYSNDMGYHVPCYRSFTAVKKPSCEQRDRETHKSVRRSLTTESAISSTGLFPNKCIFCNSGTKRSGHTRESLSTCETVDAQNTILESAEVLRDEELLVNVRNIDFIAKEVKYHNTCRSAYNKKATRATQSKEPSEISAYHNKAFNLLKGHIEDNIIEYKTAEKLTSLHKKYLEYLGNPDATYSSQTLCVKIQKAYPDIIKTHKESNKSGTVVYHHSLTPLEAIRHVEMDQNSIKEVALYLRRLVLQMSATATSLPEALSASALNTGEGSRPKELTDFFRVLYTGSNEPSHDKIERLVNSVSDDIIYTATRGRIKPGKHLTLGVGFKSMSGSRKIIDILNRFGHCINYHTVESLETDLATNITDRNHMTPDGINQHPGLCTGLAWDNYDEFTESLSGSDSLHDTVGICYQNKVPVIEETDADGGSIQTTSWKKSKRTILLKERHIEPYRKKPRITVFNFVERSVPRPASITSIEYRDMLWMMSLSMYESPMWVGWNARLTEDPLPQQRIEYMENLTLPSTRLDVIAETLRISQQVRRECGDEYSLIHYDLLMAKSALQIQMTESPRYDDIFICFGPFHTEMAYFGALGHFLDASGGFEILTEVGVLAPGSLNGVILGKHYNRCKRLHPLLSSAVQIMHFRQYLDIAGPMPDDMKDILHRLHENPTPGLLQDLEMRPEYLEFMAGYSSYRQQTLAGDHGSTAQFWMTYVDLVNIFLLYNRACRTNNLDVFIYALDQMCDIFFAASRPNYSRWMVLYLLNLLNIEHTHRGLRRVLEDGAFSVRRTAKSFSRTAVDITLEQTVNSDAASRHTGIASFTNVAAAMGRWMVTHAVRSSVVTNLMAKAGIDSTEDTTKELRSYRIRRDNEDLSKVIQGFEATMNPFTLDPDANLYCVTSGKKVRDDIKDDLLNIKSKGNMWCEEFRHGCFADPARFQRAIPRRKVKKFASAAVKSKAPAKIKIKELQCSRDLFGRLLFLSTKANLDMEKIFSYPLTTVPLALANIDGSANKNNKAKLMHHLEGKGTHDAPVDVYATVVDAMFLFHAQVNVPITYGAIAVHILRQLCSMSPRVDLVADKYLTPSIKDIERDRRGSCDTIYQINGPDQKRPNEWQKSLQSPSFKSSLVKFLASEWQRPQYAPILMGHNIYLGLEDMCYWFKEVSGAVVREVVPALHCSHEEADTRILFHVHAILRENTETSIVVRANDTDILVLLLYHVSQFPGNSKIWMDAGTASTNTRRSINVSSIIDALEVPVIEALPAIHAFTGSDFTTSFFNKGKVRPFEIMQKSPDFTACFADLGNGNNLSDADIKSTPIEQFVCALYGKPKLLEVNQARYAIFQLNYAPRNNNEPLEKIKGTNASLIPPCQLVLYEKVRRTNFVASIWKNATKPDPCRLDPQQNGWVLVNNYYQLKWFEGDTVPQDVWQVLETDSEDVERGTDLEYEDPGLDNLLYGPDDYQDLDDELYQ